MNENSLPQLCDKYIITLTYNNVLLYVDKTVFSN